MRSALLWLFFVVVVWADQCPSANRCLDEARLNCNHSSFAPVDFHCCDSLECFQVSIPSTDTQEQFNTTIRLASTAKYHSNSRLIPTKRLLIMSRSWSAATTYFNKSNRDTGWGYFWCDATYRAIRTDFYPMCPFLQLYQASVEANYVPCSVLVYEGHNYYVYPSCRSAAIMHFPLGNRTGCVRAIKRSTERRSSMHS